MDGKVIPLPARRRLGQCPPQGIVDYLFRRRPPAMDSVFDEPGDVGIQSQRGAHQGIIVPYNRGIKMFQSIASRRVGYRSGASA